jgi:A/G-specific adenine glycosylase
MAPGKRPRTRTLETGGATASKRIKKQTVAFPFLLDENAEKSLRPVLPPMRKHPLKYHRPLLLADLEAQGALLSWFEKVSKDRDMPWRQKWIDPGSYVEDPELGLDLRETLKRRAYQVWVSEIMLQQTRVETVRSYYESWHTRWPTIEDLAKASPADVLSAWRGLGYYSRATRLHTAAQKIVSDPEMNGLLPELPADLEAKVPGVGRYTAGAISSIVFGHAVPILDGNVSRVLSRQMGLYANMTGKLPTALLWEAADALVKEATWNVLVEDGIERDAEEVPRNDTPSFWNQALMELGSTLCKPQKPDCGDCPIRTTCMAYAEAERLAQKSGFLSEKDSVLPPMPISESAVVDIEDLCSLCESMEDIVVEENAASQTSTKTSSKASAKVKKPPPKNKFKQSTLSFRQANSTEIAAVETKPKSVSIVQQKQAQDIIEKHVTLFPMKVIKKAVRKEECVVCVIRRTSNEHSDWLIEQRPDRGLLASMWQFPSLTVYSSEVQTPAKGSDTDTDDEEDDDFRGSEKSKKSSARKSNAKEGNAKGSKNDMCGQQPATKPSTTTPPPPDLKERKTLAIDFVNSVLRKSYGDGASHPRNARHVTELGSITHLFSHIRLVMHVHVFEVGAEVSSVNLKSNSENAKKLFKGEKKDSAYQARKWANCEEIEAESFGTGMRRCWALVPEE